MLYCCNGFLTLQLLGNEKDVWRKELENQQTDELALRDSVDEVDASDVQNMVKILVRIIRLIRIQMIGPGPQFPSQLQWQRFYR